MAHAVDDAAMVGGTLPYLSPEVLAGRSLRERLAKYFQVFSAYLSGSLLPYVVATIKGFYPKRQGVAARAEVLRTNTVNVTMPLKHQAKSRRAADGRLNIGRFVAARKGNET